MTHKTTLDDNTAAMLKFAEEAADKQAAAEIEMGEKWGAAGGAAATAANPLQMPENWRERCRSTSVRL